MEPRALHVLGKQSATELHPQWMSPFCTCGKEFYRDQKYSPVLGGTDDWEWGEAVGKMAPQAIFLLKSARLR